MKGAIRARKEEGNLKWIHKLVREYIKEPYIQKIEVINKDTINLFVRPEWHRDFRDTHISSIRNSLLKGNHFSEPITVNEIGKYRIINGNHRMEAIRQILHYYPDFSMEVRLTCYKNLSVEKELEIYDIVNKVKPENALDVIKAHCINCEFLKCVEKQGFPIRILFRNRGKKDRNSLPITTIIMPYILRNGKKFVGATTLAVDKINELTEEDYERVRNFFTFYKSVFGDITKENLYSHTSLIVVMAKIYYNNVGIDIGKDQLVNKLNVIKQRHTANLMSYTANLSWDNYRDLYLFLLEKLKVRKPLFNVMN